MRLKYILLPMLIPLLDNTSLSAQQGQNAMGRIVYEVPGKKNPSYVEMWFNSASYLYQIRRTPREQQLVRSERSNVGLSLEDSIAISKKAAEMNAALNNQPVQTFYGEIGNNVVVFSGYTSNDNKKYCITDTLNFIAWTVVEDTLSVDGILCQKANGVYKDASYTAWFATAIPVSAAPWNQRGLPGLLIKSTNDKTKAEIHLLELEWPLKKPVRIAPCGNAPLISKAEFSKKINTSNIELLRMADYYKEQLEKKKKGEIKEVKLINH